LASTAFFRPRRVEPVCGKLSDIGSSGHITAASKTSEQTLRNNGIHRCRESDEVLDDFGRSDRRVLVI